MFKDTPEGQTNYCSHTTDNTICPECLGYVKENEEAKIDDADLSLNQEYNNLQFHKKMLDEYIEDLKIVWHNGEDIVFIDWLKARKDNADKRQNAIKKLLK